MAVPLSEAKLRAECAKLIEELDALSHEHLTLQSEVGNLREKMLREESISQLLARCAEIMNSRLDLKLILSRVLDLAVDFMQAERGFIALTRQDEPLKVSVRHNLDQVAYEADQPVSQSIIERVLASGKLVITTDAQTDPRFSAEQSIIAQHIRSIMCVPLMVRDTVIGVVYLDSRVLPGLFTRRDPELLIAFAHLAGPAIENARLFAQERARLAEISALEAFRTRILETVAGGIITIDNVGRISGFNRAAEETFGIDAAAIVGQPIRAIDARIPDFSALIAHGRDNSEVRLSYVNGLHVRGDVLALELRVAPIDSANTVVVVNDLTAQRALETSFSRYLAPHVVQSLIHDPQSIHLGGERDRATILFADIRGFTAMSARMHPEAVVELLNRYLERAVSVVFNRDGLLDKFYGDGLMAAFGPPRPRTDDAIRAVQTAIDLHRAVDEISRTLKRDLRISIGLATGDVVAGHIGSMRRMDYTVIGDAVNLASRLQAKAGPGTILCDEVTYLAAGSPSKAEAFDATIRGREETMRLFALKF